MIVRLAGVEYELTHESGQREGETVTTAMPAVHRSTMVVIGDSYSSPSLGPTSWPVLVANAAGLELVNFAVGGAGYVRATLRTFPSAATEVPEDAAVVVVLGGINDAWMPEQVPNVREAARATFGAVRRLAPGAVLVVVGPQWNLATWPAPAEAFARRDAVRERALAAGAVWVDPLDERWFADPATIGPDQLHPNDLGQQLIATRLTPVVVAARHRAGVMLTAANY